MRALALALFLPLLASPVLAAKSKVEADPQSVELHFLPQPGDKLRQSIDMKMQMAMNMLPGPDMTDEQRARLVEAAKKMGQGMSMDMKMALRSEASEADAKGDFLLHLRGEGGQIHLHMPDQPVKDIPNPIGSIELDALTNVAKGEFDILRVKSPAPGLTDPKMLDAMGKGLLKQAFGAMSALEGRRMKIGDSAEIPFDLQMPMAQLPANAHINASIAITLKAIRKGVATFDTVVKMALDAASDESQPQKLKIDMNGSGTGVIAYRIADRLPMRHDMDVTMHMDVHTAAGGDTQIDMKMKMLARAERYR